MMFYLWPDVALVYLLSAVPLGVLIGRFVGLRLRQIDMLVVGVVFLCCVPQFYAFVGDVIFSAGSRMPESSSSSPVNAFRFVTLTLTSAIALFWFAARGPSSADGKTNHIVVGVVCLLVWLILPRIYLDQRARYDVARLEDLLDQSRLGEAHSLARDLARLAPQTKCRGRSVEEWALSLRGVVRQLEASLDAPLPPDASHGQQIERSRNLAILGRTQEALDVLNTIKHPSTHSLRATILQAREEWHASLMAAELVVEGWNPTRASEQQTAQAIQAYRDLAYAHRKLGHYDKAEAAYQQVLTLAPTADTHFLLARFYEDAQHAEKSRAHARQAMALDPARYQKAGENLIRKLSVFQFGCWGVFSAERKSGINAD